VCRISECCIVPGIYIARSSFRLSVYTLSFYSHTKHSQCIYISRERNHSRGYSVQFWCCVRFHNRQYSSAVHVLRDSALRGEKTYSGTVYNLLASALTTGHFIKDTLKDSTHNVHGSLLIQLRVTFAMFLCSATIMLLNILIQGGPKNLHISICFMLN